MGFHGWEVDQRCSDRLSEMMKKDLNIVCNRIQ